MMQAGSTKSYRNRGEMTQPEVAKDSLLDAMVPEQRVRSVGEGYFR